MPLIPFKTKREQLEYLAVRGHMITNTATGQVVFLTQNDELNKDVDLEPAQEWAPYEAPKTLYHYICYDDQNDIWFQPQRLFRNDQEFTETLRVKHFKRIEPGIEIQL